VWRARCSSHYLISAVNMTPKYWTANSSKNEAANYVIVFVSLVINLYLSVGSTLYVFWIPLRRPKDNRYR